MKKKSEENEEEAKKIEEEIILSEEEKKRKLEELRREQEKENQRIMEEYNKCLNIQNDGDIEQNFENIDEPQNDFFKSIIPVSKSSFKEFAQNFKETDAFNLIIDKLYNFNEPYPDLDIGDNNKSYNMIHLNDEVETSNYPVKNLLKLSYDISAYLISISSLNTIPFSKICVNILFDVSLFISEENKLFNMFLVCCTITALTNMEIPYSITLIADENFKCTIKRFSDESSLEILQKVLDCIFVRRFYTNLANTTKFAINNLFYQPMEERPYRAFITFTNGLDERLFIAESWERKVFNACSNPSQNKFGYVFMKSDLLIGEKLNKMEKIWKRFESINSKYLKLVIINYPDKYQELNLNKLEEKNNLIVKFGEMFTFTLQFPQIMNKQPNIEKIKPILPNFNADKLDNLDNIDSLRKRNFSNNYGIYINKTDILLEAKKLDLPLDNKYYKNYFGKIMKVDINPNIREKLNQLISYMKENKKKLGPYSIESVFKFNFATQKVLSTQGSEFDITALIFHLLNPSPNPRIYLQKKTNDKRKYSVTIVVDSSYSCYNNLSGSHSFQTLRALLSSLNIYDLPSLNLIITGEKEPYVLCSNVPSLKALKTNSNIWESFFKIIQMRPIKTDLFSAISAAYDLKRLHPEDYPSYLFVLTDGLFDFQEQKNLINILGMCANTGMNIFGIGVGIYPGLINNIFPQVLYCMNPNDIMKGIAYFMGENIYSKIDNLEILFSEENSLNNLEDIFKSLKSNINSPIFYKL